MIILMPPSLPRSRRIVYVSELGHGSTAAYRFGALRRLGQDAHAFDVLKYAPKNRYTNWLRFRYPVWPVVARINRDLVKMVRSTRPDVVWFDKPIYFTRWTMRAIRKTGAKIVFYMQDAPFGLRNDGCWMQFLKVLRKADLHCLFRTADVERYSAWGLPWIGTLFSFEPGIHFPPPPGLNDANRDRVISYIGFPYEQRPAFLLSLARDYKFPVFINGPRWEDVLTPEEQADVTLGGYLAADDYRSGIWRSAINLSFVTEDNEDDIAHKAVEIAACGSFLMAVRTPGHEALFDEDREAVFFSSVKECAEKARFYLSRPDLREAIAARGRERAVRSGYDNDTQLARVLNRLDGIED